MKRLLSIASAALVCSGVVADAAIAKGLDSAAPEGVTVRGSTHRYVAMSPGIPRAVTVIARVERQGGRLSRWWYLRGKFHVPAVAYDGTAGGLSADGRTLVLSRSHSSHTYPPRVSRFAVLDTQRSSRRRGSGHPPRFRQLADFVDLRGHYSFDAISPDGSTAYLIHHYLPPSAGGAYITTYEVRALDLRSGRLLPQPIVDPSEPDEKMRGLPVTRAASPDGRWAYTLYDDDGQEPFIHALDTVGRRAICIDLPQLAGERNVFMLALRANRSGRELEVVRRRFRMRRAGQAPARPELEPLLTVDTRSFEVRRPKYPRVAWALGDMPWLSAEPADGFLAFAQAPRRPGNLLLRAGTVGRSAEGRPIGLRQLGDPAIEGEVLVFGCIHGDECAAREIQPVMPASGCPDPASDVYLVPNLNPDGLVLGTRLNGRGVDLNRNFPVEWKPIGRRGGPQHSGPRPLSEPETRLAARIVERLRPEVTIWFHQHHEAEPLVRAWGGSIAAARRFAVLAGLPFRRLPWLAGTAPNWQNRRFPGTSSFVVEMPRGPLQAGVEARLGRAVVLLAREVGED